MQSSHARSDDKAATRGQVMSTFTPCRSERVATPYLGWSLDGHDFYGSQSVRPIKEDWEVTVRLLLKGSTCSGTTPIHCLNITYYCLDVPRTCNCAKSASFVALSVKQPSHVHNNKPSKVLGPVQQPKGPCFVAGCYRSPLSRNGQPVSGELYNKMSQRACFHGHPHLPC